MKTWLFALLESIIAALGLFAYFWADNVILASAAVLMAAAIGIVNPLLTASRQRRLQAYHHNTFQQASNAVDSQLKALLDEVIDPPLPHRATVVSVLHNCFGRQARDLIEQYDEVVDAIQTGSQESTTLAADFADRVEPWSVGSYLRGLAELATGSLDLAHEYFLTATVQQTSWIAPWLGWATAAYRRGLTDEIREKHPHMRGVELLPYDAGDEASFLKLNDAERTVISEQFQSTAKSLGNFYAIAEFCKSKDQIDTSEKEFKKVA